MNECLSFCSEKEKNEILNGMDTNNQNLNNNDYQNFANYDNVKKNNMNNDINNKNIEKNEILRINNNCLDKKNDEEKKIYINLDNEKGFIPKDYLNKHKNINNNKLDYNQNNSNNNVPQNLNKNMENNNKYNFINNNISNNIFPNIQDNIIFFLIIMKKIEMIKII